MLQNGLSALVEIIIVAHPDSEDDLQGICFRDKPFLTEFLEFDEFAVPQALLDPEDCLMLLH